MAQSITGMAVPVTYGAATTVNGSAPVVTVCTPASGSVFSVGVSTVTCTATDALQRTDTCSFPVTVVAPPRLPVTKFLAFGDSITRGEDGNSAVTATSATRFHPAVLLPDGQTYPGVLQQDLAGRYTAQMPTVFNAGNPGEAVTDPATFPRFTSYTSSRLFEAVLLMEGSNDLYQQKDASNLAPTISGLRQMLRDARSRGMQGYLATIPPINPLGSRGRMYGSQLVPALNDGIRALGAAEGVPVVDVNQLFGGSFALLGADGLHPTAEGYAKIADLFFATIKSTLETTPAAAYQPATVRRPILRTRQKR
jgi:lysophospholipase L1-like esterase